MAIGQAPSLGLPPGLLGGGPAGAPPQPPAFNATAPGQALPAAPAGLPGLPGAPAFGNGPAAIAPAPEQEGPATPGAQKPGTPADPAAPTFGKLNTFA